MVLAGQGRTRLAVVSERAAQTGWMCLGIVKRAALRCWGRDVMLYVGGVSFFALLALFPAVGLLIGFYSAVFTPEQAEMQTQAFAQLMPEGARGLVEHQLHHLAATSARTISVQSGLALIIGAYAAHRGFKALLAGLTFIHDEEEPWGFLRFNFIAFVVAIGSFVMATSLSGLIIASRIVKTEAHLRTGETFSWFTNEWLWVTLFLVFGLTCLYRWAMSHSGTVIWRAAIIGGVTATFLAVCASAASAFYVNQIMHLGATYGSIATVIVFLIWVSWNVNAVFFGGALATEVEIVLDAYNARRRAEAMPPEASPGLSSPERAFRP